MVFVEVEQGGGDDAHVDAVEEASQRGDEEEETAVEDGFG